MIDQNRARGDAKVKWFALAPIYERVGMLTAADLEKFAHYIQDSADVIRYRQEIRQQGEMIIGVNKKGQEYQQINYIFTLLNQALDRINKTGIQFGDSPAARARLSVDDEHSGSSLASFIKTRPTG
jgi:phage terminase small subunit